jgi:L-malate glycosyltransferase
MGLNKTIKLAVLESKYGGDATSVNDLVTGFDREQFEVIFLYLRRKGSKANHLEQQGFKVLYLSDKTSLRTFHLGTLTRLVRVLKQHGIQLLHCHAHKSTVYGALAGMLLPGLKIVAHVHGLKRSARLRRRLMNLAVFWRINRLLPVAQAVKQDLLACNWALPPNKAIVLENSVDYARFAEVKDSKWALRQEFDLKSDAFIFASVGRLVPTKGLDYLIDAFSQIDPAARDAHLLLVGEGRDRQKCELQGTDLAVDKRVHFAGYRRDIESIFHGVDVFVMSSVAEGMPRVLLEAMAAQKPCIGTRVGGIPEVINESFGLVVKPADSRSLAQAMQKMACLSPHEHAVLGENARAEAERRFSHTVVREKLKRVYLDLLGGRS